MALCVRRVATRAFAAGDRAMGRTGWMQLGKPLESAKPTWGGRFSQVLSRLWGAGFNTSQYWERRHMAAAGELRSTGHTHLTEAQNRVDYDAKRAAIETKLGEWVGDAAGQSLLDAGCGTGLFSETFSQLGFSVTGVDFSPTAIDAARRRTSGRFQVADLSRMSLDERFDIVASIDVLFHVVDDRVWSRTLEQMMRHVADGGCFVVQEHLVEAAPDTAPGDSHVRFRTIECYDRALADIGATIRDHYRYDLPSERSWKDLLLISRASALTDKSPCDDS